MNRRSFLKTTTACAITAPFLSFGTPVGSSYELEDLYAFCERQTIPHYSYETGTNFIPFKLFPFQKRILKQIHENDFTIFIKARQIGMSYLTAAYCAWQQSRLGDKLNTYGASCSYSIMQSWNLRFNRFGGKDNEKMSWPNPEHYNIIALDELNWDSFASPEWLGLEHLRDPNDRPISVFQGFFEQLIDEMKVGYVHDTPSSGKLILYGTPDPYGNLQRAALGTESKFCKTYGFKTFRYPSARCRELWALEREEWYRTNFEHLYPDSIKRELDAII